jgi:hypothetical protein
MNDVETIGRVNIAKITEELKLLKISAQFSLQGKSKDDFNSSTSYDYSLREDEKEFIYPLYDLPYTNSILEEFKLFRTRVMKMINGTAYGLHVDNTPRIHIPLETNDKCLFIIDDVVYRMPADGSVYFADTTKPHTAINANTNRFIRTHIVGNINV